MDSFSVLKTCFILYMLQYADSIERGILWNKPLLRGYTQCRQQGYPNKTDRIAIIGAGAAGVHMAYKLQRLGYTDVTVIEKTNRIGGKCLTLDHKGTRQEMGAIYIGLNYDEIFKLLKEFDVGPAVRFGETTRWINQYTYFQNDYPLYVITKEYGITDPTNATHFLQDAIRRYITLHKSMFSDYEGELFPRPNSTILYMTRGTFMNFLRRNKVDVLKTIFDVTFTSFGYGKLDEISALYGLMWNTPEFLSATNSPGFVAKILSKGYQKIWEAIVKKERIKIIFNANIQSITRKKNIQIRYAVKQEECGRGMKSNEFDFLILASNVKDLITTSLRSPSSQERRIFNKLKPAYFTVTLVDSMYGRRSPNPSDYFLYRHAVDHTVWISLDPYGMLNTFSGQNYTNGQYPGNSNGEFIQSSVFYQYGANKPDKADVISKFRDHMMTFGFGKNYTVIQRILWSYFPKFSPSDMSSGILWDILDMQGYKNTWYIGSSVSFESVNSVVEYNKLVLRKFNLE